MTLKQIQASEQIMRIAINGQNHVDSLIGYYRDTIDNFNEERIQWIQHYQTCKDNVSKRHLLERQIAANETNRIELENQLAALKGELTYERQKYFYKAQQNQKIKQNLHETKRKLQELTQICKPLFIQNSHVKSICSVKTNAFNSAQKLSKKPVQKQSSSNLRQELELQLINLDRDHQDKRQVLQKTIQQLKDQLDEIVSEHSNRGKQCSEEYKEALNKLSDLESKHMNLVGEFFKYRMQNLEEQQKIQQQNQIIRLKNLALVQKLKNLQQSHSTQFKTIDKEVKKKNKQFKQKYDEELKKKQEHLSILKEQHQRISDIYLNKLKKLESELRTTIQKTKVSSLKSQIKILNNRLQNVAINQMRSQIVQNGQNQSEQQSSVTLQMQELERINKQVKDLQKQLEKK